MEDMRVLERYGLLAADALEATKRAIWGRCGGARDARAWMLYVNVEVGGTRDGSRVTRTYKVSHPVQWGEQGVARMTGIPAAVGAQLLARHGRIATIPRSTTTRSSSWPSSSAAAPSQSTAMKSRSRRHASEPEPDQRRSATWRSSTSTAST
jgi:hypothetical protein